VRLCADNQFADHASKVAHHRHQSEDAERSRRRFVPVARWLLAWPCCEHQRAVGTGAHWPASGARELGKIGLSDPGRFFRARGLVFHALRCHPCGSRHVGRVNELFARHASHLAPQADRWPADLLELADSPR
jgi:hypothetical protein